MSLPTTPKADALRVFPDSEGGQAAVRLAPCPCLSFVALRGQLAYLWSFEVLTALHFPYETCKSE